MKRFLFILLAVVMVMGSTVTAFAMEYPSTLPEPPAGENSDYIVVKYSDTGAIRLYQIERLEEDYDVLYVDDGRYSAERPYALELDMKNFKFYIYDLNDGVWKHHSTHVPDGSEHILLSAYAAEPEILYSDVDVKDIDTGNVVFPLPLAEEIRGVAEETLTVETMPELTKTVLVVVLCGVGCLALVTSLVLLRKVLPTFLN